MVLSGTSGARGRAGWGYGRVQVRRRRSASTPPATRQLAPNTNGKLLLLPVRGRFAAPGVVVVTGPPCPESGTVVAVDTEVPPGWLDVVSDELVGDEVVVPPGIDVVEP